MSTLDSTVAKPTKGLSRDFQIFWIGQTISNLGNSISRFVLPLLVFKLTGSSVQLAIAATAYELPPILVGLVIGAWIDRVDRRKLMLLTDVGRAIVIASIPILALLNLLSLWWIYVSGFLLALLTVCFDNAELTSIPSLVEREDLITANGRIQASYAAAMVLGPVLAGLLLTVLSIELLLALDVVSFAISGWSLLAIRRSFNPAGPPPQTRLRDDIAEGLRYVWHHPVLRSISAMMVIFYGVSYTTTAQLVLFAKEWLQVSDSQTSVLFAAGGVGSLVLALAAEPLRRRLPFSAIQLGAIMLQGLLTVALALNRSFWLAVVLWGTIVGLNTMFVLLSFSLRQAIVPNHLLGRVVSVAMVIASALVPLGIMIGGFVIERVQNVSLVYTVIGVAVFLLGLAFTLSPLRHAERYIKEATEAIERAERAGAA
jgi:MFS family permease